MDILVITTGGTFDKVYFDAKSDYQVGEPYVGNLLEEGNVTLNYEILSILKKDSLDIKEAVSYTHLTLPTTPYV